MKQTKQIKPVCAYVGGICRAARLRKGYSLQDVGDEFGYSKSYLSDFENGRADSLLILMTAYREMLTDDDILSMFIGRL